MKRNKLVGYIKQRPYSVLIPIVALFVSFSKELHIESMIFFASGIVIEYHHYHSRKAFLAKTGLTDQQYNDKEFYTKWNESRQQGLAKYCFYDGGLIAGSILSIIIGAFFVTHKTLGDVSTDFGIMVAIIWKSFVLGFMLCTLLYRFLWIFCERRFNRLSAQNPHFVGLTSVL